MIAWTDFRMRVNKEYLRPLSKNSARMVNTALNHAEKHIAPDSPLDLTASRLSKLWEHLARKGVSRESIDKYESHIRGVQEWAQGVRLVKEIPIRNKRKGKRKTYRVPGRPLTEDEYQRMLACAIAADPIHPQRIRFFLEGLWLSGLRISEAVELSWNQGLFYVDTSGKFFMLRVSARFDKAGKDRLLPMTPDFGALLERVPAEHRVGKIFQCGDIAQARSLIHKCAKAAGIITVHEPKLKYASAHDFRRSFASRWARKVKAPVLQKLMRHESITTTLKHYVSLDAEEIAQDLVGV